MTLTAKNLPSEIETVGDVRSACSIIQAGFSKMRREVNKVIVGQGRVVDLVLVAVFADGHALLEGPPGLGKTLLVRTLGDVLQLSTGRIQCTADLMPADIVGTVVVDEDSATKARRFTFREGPVFHQLLLADEINRATPKCQSALLESMQEHSVSIDGKTRLLPEPFFVLATQNPIEQEGTYPLPEAQLDRFMFKIDVENASQEDLYEIVSKTTSGAHLGADVVVQGDFVLAAQQIIRHVVIAPHVQDYVTRLVLATHAGSEYAPLWVQDDLSIGASPRGAQAIISASKVAAVVDGRFAVSMRDIQAVAIPALQHRVVRTFEAETASRSTGSMIARLLNEVSSFEEGVH